MGTATIYDPRLSLREARTRYFVDNDFGAEGNYDERWVKVALGPIPFAFPNSAARVKAVRYHDLHHVLTGYATTMTGEAEIGAWELASGCGAMPAAWILNMLALAIGLVADRRAAWAAFVRGRHSENLYRLRYDDALLERSLGEQRRELGLDREPPEATAADRAAFGAYAIGGALMFGVALAVLLAPLVALAWLGLAMLG
ncbi:Coq4 family protein [Paraliomyxa miuraensis]|uniref:Coq4 family protein n=1 Tax=Paraliomyxa miuraensis TaxID=376150 RepID=UPI00225B92AE|nr:Coq4 family protein [Paraliomyxa miuraensis]MCX4246207.1 ubiquinone biosynthesis protein COQ4 [Paraliomyxa miuraensis]